TEMIGSRTRIKVVKNKVAPPFKQALVDIMYGEGISKEGEILDIASDIDVVEKSGAWYSYKGERLGQGRENAKVFLSEHPEMYEEIHQTVRDHYELDGVKEVVEEEEEGQEQLDLE